jgi:hypothetical protein
MRQCCGLSSGTAERIAQARQVTQRQHIAQKMRKSHWKAVQVVGYVKGVWLPQCSNICEVVPDE